MQNIMRLKPLGNLNNEIGLLGCSFRIDEAVEAAVIEMGMNHFGEIHRLSTAAKPTIGLINQYRRIPYRISRLKRGNT